MLIYLLLVATPIVFANGLDTVPDKPVYYERTAKGLTRFFYDDRYFLADKDCQFKAIERVGQYDFQQQVFTGEFTDFNYLGRAILKGNYRNGRKEGEFSAYHPNGQLKWVVSYVQDIPQGLRTYYYPDGKPLLEVEYREGGTFIRSFWDQRGRKQVSEGKGKYEFAVEADGYNEFGYVRYIRKGRVVDGRPHGIWGIEYLFADGKKANAGYERYQYGVFQDGYEQFKEESFYDGPRYGVLPADFYVRADAMIGKGCTIDEYSGFTVYLSKHLEEWFDGEVDELPDPVKIEFTVAVKKSGEPGKIEMTGTFPRKRYADLLLEAIGWVNFWFPSFADGDFIDDNLTVSVEAFPDAAERKLRFFDVTIRREKGI